jgi:hypothetical protein
MRTCGRNRAPGAAQAARAGAVIAVDALVRMFFIALPL